MKCVNSDFAWFILSAIAVLAAPPPCYAGIVPPIDVDQYANGMNSIALGAITKTTTNSYGSGTGAAGASYEGGTASEVFANGISTPAADSPPGTAGVLLRYYFEVKPTVLAPPDTEVPVVFLFVEETFAVCSPTPGSCGTSYALAEVDIAGGSPLTIDNVFVQCSSAPTVIFFSNPSTTCFPSDLPFENSYTFEGSADVGDIYQISLNANVYAGPGGYASMKIDPQIFIDPSFPDAADYTLEFSAFTQSTPEPSTTSLLSAGLLALLGAGMCKRLHAKLG